MAAEINSYCHLAAGPRMRASTFYFPILLIFRATLEGGDYEWPPHFMEEETEAQRHLPPLGGQCGVPQPRPHLVQELYRGPQDLPPLVHLDAVELLLQSQDLCPLCSRLGELAVGGNRA